MNPVWSIASLILCFLLAAPVSAQPSGERQVAPPPRVDTNNHTLEGYLREMIRELEGDEGRWTFNLYDVEMMLVSDEDQDRVRLMAPILPADRLDAALMRTLLEANFDRAMDARYSIWKESVWASYAHPLSSLTGIELRSGVRQVANLVRNFGTSFASTDLQFMPDK